MCFSCLSRHNSFHMGLTDMGNVPGQLERQFLERVSETNNCLHVIRLTD